LSPDELTPEHQQRFLEARRGAGYRSWLGPQSLRVPLAHLREAGVVAAPAPVVAEGPVERLVADSRWYLAGERGLAAETIGHYERVARLFLADRETLDGLELDRLAARDVSAFLARECPKRSVSGARDLVMRLRSLLRYLHVAGVIELPLQWAVPGVAYRRDHGLPRGLSPSAVARLLASCDRRRAVGRRDYAVLLLLSRLGLRAGEVAAIQLEDIDWRRGEFQVRGKGARLDRLPLPIDVGQAIVSYLQRRPHSRSRAVFLLAYAPYSPYSRYAVSCIVRVSARSLSRSALTGCAIPPRPRCCGRAGRCRRSRRCCVTVSSRPRGSMPTAPRGALLYPRRSREELEGTFLGQMAYLDPKAKGDNSMPVNDGHAQASEVRRRETRVIW